MRSGKIDKSKIGSINKKKPKKSNELKETLSNEFKSFLSVNQPNAKALLSKVLEHAENMSKMDDGTQNDVHPLH